MKKLLSLLVVLVLVLATPAMAANAGNAVQDKPLPQNRIEQLTGSVWMASSQEAKLALLFGIELALNVDKIGTDMANAKIAKNPKAKKSDYRKMSYFTESWYKAFANVPLPEIASQIDAWYAAHLDQKDRLVLGVLWKDIMKMPAPAQK